MNETNVPTPEQVLPPTQEVPPTVPKKSSMPYIIGGMTLFIIIMILLVTIQSRKQATPVVVAEPTPFQAITPTPMRSLSRLATTSAFVQFHDEVASLSGTLNSFNFLDATLTPPIFDINIEITP